MKNWHENEFPPISYSEKNGVRLLHFGLTTRDVQGAMLLASPNRLLLEYTQRMMGWLLFVESPQSILQLGLGAAALTKFCYHHFPQAKLKVVELNPKVVDAAQEYFHLPPADERLALVCANASEYVQEPAQRESATVIQVDIYDDNPDRGPTLDSVDFYRGCRAVLQTPGVLTVNLYGDMDNMSLSLNNLRDAFDGQVLTIAPMESKNVIALAFKGAPPKTDWDHLSSRAEYLQQEYGWPAFKWIAGLQALPG